MSVGAIECGLYVGVECLFDRVVVLVDDVSDEATRHEWVLSGRHGVTVAQVSL